MKPVGARRKWGGPGHRNEGPKGRLRSEDTERGACGALLAEEQKGRGMWRAVRKRWGRQWLGVWAPGRPQGDGGGGGGQVPAGSSHLCVQLGQLLLVQVGLFVNAGLVPELRRGAGEVRQRPESGPGQEAGLPLSSGPGCKQPRPGLGGQRGASLLWGCRPAMGVQAYYEGTGPLSGCRL